MGVSIFPVHGTDMEQLLINADQALSSAKNDKGNYYEVFYEEMTRSSKNPIQMESKLFHAIKENTLELYYQPKVDIQTNQIVGMEALLRWTDPELGPIPPSEFIPFAEECGLIVQIGEWVLRTAAEQLKVWKKEYGIDLKVTVNISPLHFKEPNFIKRLIAIVNEVGVEPGNLEIEITEMSMLNYNDHLVRKIEQINEIGMTVAIDDFGTGYSSLSYLKEFSVDTLKIDRSFIVNMQEGESGIAMVAAIISLAHALNLTVVAEGVEKEEELVILKKYNCEFVQGYYFNKPLNVHDFTELIESML